MSASVSALTWVPCLPVARETETADEVAKTGAQS